LAGLKACATGTAGNLKPRREG